MTHPSYRRKLIGIPVLLLLLFSFISCRSVRINPQKQSVVVVRESHGNVLLDDVSLHLAGPDIDKPIFLGTTDALGYAELAWKELEKQLPDAYRRDDYHLIFERSFADDQGIYTCRDSVRLNDYLGVIDLYIDSSRGYSPAHTFAHLKPVADMHYHISMRTHNRFGDRLYFNSDTSVGIPDNVNLFRSFPHLKVLYAGKWRKPYLGKIDFEKSEKSRKWARRRDKMKTLLHTQWVRPQSKHTVNHLRQYTQATHPHMVEGGVYLGYNAISPFEHNVSNSGKKRFANMTFVTKANKHWLRRIGWKTDTMTHWQNFNHEYGMINSQKGFYDHAGWRFFDHDTDLLEDKPTIIHVLEGSHVFQDELFPHVVTYNIDKRSASESRDLFNSFINRRLFDQGRPLRAPYAQLIASLQQQAPLRQTAVSDIVQALALPKPEKVSKHDWRMLSPEMHLEINAFVDQLMLEELTGNIDSLKRLAGPPIAMVTIAHLAYNGMMGHAPGLNGGGFFTKLFARKNYSIRVSDDPMYKKQWASAFFTIPGVNKFGKAVIDRLISTDNGHRILIDLKHSDFFTRKYFFENVMINRQTGDTIPPICSHCGVTGLPSPYYSPLTDEFSLLQSSSVTTFYPFAINIFDEEITTICQNGGIIGIPLFQQVLGGNIKTRRARDYRIRRDGSMVTGKRSRVSRHKEIKRLFAYYQREGDPLVDQALQYTREEMGIAGDEKRIMRITADDYISAEPFIQNLFHILDHSGLETEAAWSRVCIGSDLDGLIDPIDICPTASLYPNFRSRLRQFIPVFLQIRSMHTTNGPAKQYEDYFPPHFDIDRALDLLFYESLRNFSAQHLLLGSKDYANIKTP